MSKPSFTSGTPPPSPLSLPPSVLLPSELLEPLVPLLLPESVLKPQLETANTSIYPDIVLKKDGVRVLPIELKRPTNNLKKKNERQLFSYMRQLEIRVGLYIGEKMQLYYNAPDDTDAPHAILTTDFQPDSHEGAILCDLLSFDHFDIKQLEMFCAERLEKKRYREQLKKEFDKTFSEENGTTFLKRLIKEHFIEGCKDNAILDEEISKIELHALYGNHKRTSKLGVLQGVSSLPRARYNQWRWHRIRRKQPMGISQFPCIYQYSEEIEMESQRNLNTQICPRYYYT